MNITKIAIAGSGIMGSSWAIVYARAGLNVAIFDRNPETRSLVIGKIADALMQSCDTWFYQVGIKTGGKKMGDWAVKLGFGARTGIPLRSTTHRPRAAPRFGG